MLNVGDKVVIVDSGLYGSFAKVLGVKDIFTGKTGVITCECENGAYMINSSCDPKFPAHHVQEENFHLVFYSGEIELVQ